MIEVDRLYSMNPMLRTEEKQRKNLFFNFEPKILALILGYLAKKIHLSYENWNLNGQLEFQIFKWLLLRLPFCMIWCGSGQSKL